MKKRLLALILSMTLFVLSVVGVGAVDATQSNNTFSVVSMDPETGIESKKIYDLSGNNFDLLSETILSTTEPVRFEGTPVSRVTQESFDNTVAPCHVFDENDLTLVANTKEEPYSAIAYLEVIYKDYYQGIGTCYLISKNVAVTAAHCIYSEEHGGWPLSVAVFPGKKGVGFWNDPFSSCYAGNWVVDEKWLEIERSDEYTDSEEDQSRKTIAQMGYDWGIIELLVPLGNKSNFITIESPDTTNIANAPIKLSGYPARIDSYLDIQDCLQLEDDGTVAFCNYKDEENDFVEEITNRGIMYFNDIDTENGTSGSPILYKKEDSYVSYAINSGEVHINSKGGYYNYATIITPDMYSYFMGYVAGNN